MTNVPVKKNYLKLSLLTAVFVIPLMLSIILFYYHDYFNLKTLNHGKLLNKPIEVNYLYSAMANGKEKKWRIMHVSDNYCDEVCVKKDYELSQLQKALGKDSNRVLLVLMGGNYIQLAKLENTISAQEKNNFSVKNKIYLIDPLGNLFMYYPSDVNSMNIMKDLKRVLEVSQIG